MDRALPRLHIVTDDVVLRGDGFRTTVARLLSRGGERIALHLRGHGLGGRELWSLAEFCGREAGRTGAALIVNDRADVAIGCDAAGVQIGGLSFRIGEARTLVGSGRWVGASVHSRPEVLMAHAEGADFVIMGTLYETSSHPGRPGAGVGLLSKAGPHPLPVIGIGGVSPDRVREVLAAGADGVAVIGGIWAARSPVDALESYLAELE